ncbi:hypothetical protein M758_3G089100 [Ceratodon purpureus]|uniref:Uncharacterized protein n=1 Tax=Ceratodon purpureus TaxID=3225 RepID=A0A8T0IK42_CERPU|nr:hypothetical protein KC19_3G087300 [Ceratodon purpureus]KAG0622310.1 hypothetical protein M758_3G089100 [Ceratodon purpureus]
MMNLLRHVAICWCFVRCGCLKRQGTTVLCSALPPGFCDRLHALLCSALLFLLASAIFCMLCSALPPGFCDILQTVPQSFGCHFPASFSSHVCSAHPAMLVLLRRLLKSA